MVRAVVVALRRPVHAVTVTSIANQSGMRVARQRRWRPREARSAFRNATLLMAAVRFMA